MTRPRLLLLALLLAAPTLLRAEVPPEGAARQASAATAVDALIEDAKARQDLPRLSNPREEPALRDFWDPAALGNPPYTAADLEALNVIISHQGRVMRTYSLYVPPPGTPPVPGGNDARFQDEITQGVSFVLANMTAFLESFLDIWQHASAASRAGPLATALPELQRGATLTVSAVLDGLSIPGLTPANAAILNQALERHAKAVTAHLTLDSRAKLQQEAAAAARKAPAEARTGLATLMAALDSPACEGFCAIK